MKCQFSEQILFIGLGQCGNNIAYDFHEKGYDCLLINSTRDDLKPFTELADEYKIHLGGGSGSEKNPKISEKLCMDNFPNIVKTLNTLFPNVKFAFVNFSLDGGTGGSAIVLANALSQALPNTTFILNGVAPKFSCGHRSKYNTLTAYNKLVKVQEKMPIMLWDNNSEASIFAVNRAIVERIDSLLSLNIHPSKKGNIDVSEIKRMLKTTGFMFMFDIKSLSEDSNPIKLDKHMLKPLITVNGKFGAIAYSLTKDDDFVRNEVREMFGTAENDNFKGYNPTQSFAVVAGAPIGTSYFLTMSKLYDEEKQMLNTAVIPKALSFELDDFDSSQEKKEDIDIDNSNLKNLFDL